MKPEQKNTALVGAMVSGLLSLPLTWMSIKNAQIQGGFGQFPNPFGAMTFDVTGFNGHVTFLFKTPIWFIVFVAIAASGLQLMSNTKVFAVPNAAKWVLAIIALIWVGVAVIVGIFSSQATLGIGALLGLIAAVVPLICLCLGESSKTDQATPVE